MLPPARPGTKPKKADFDVIADCLDYGITDNKIFIADSRKGFFIKVFDHQGTPLYEITPPYEKIKVPETFKRNYMKETRESKNWERIKMAHNFIFKEYYPAFFSFKIKDRRLYLTTYAEKYKKYEMVVMDLKGKEIARVFVFPFNPFNRSIHAFNPVSSSFDISKNNLYYLQENPESEMWELYEQRIH